MNTRNSGKVPRSRSTSELGLVQIYTGNGKGKTTAALGLAVRACLHGYRVVFIQFMKGTNYGEDKLSEMIPNFQLEKFGRKEFVDPKNPHPKDLEEAKEALKRAKELAEDCDMMILDEINVAIHFGLLDIDEVMDFVKNKPKHLELVLTGRYAPKELIEIADLVSEVREIKHPYSRGITARRGIEY